MNALLPYFQGATHDYSVLTVQGVAIQIALENERPGAKPSAVRPGLATGPGSGGDLMPWGEGNNLPQQIVDLYSRDPIIPQTLSKIAAMIIGKGIMPVTETIDEAGKEKAVYLPDPEINAFVNSLDFRRYLRDCSSDTAWFFNAWPELILSRDRSKILPPVALNAEEVRWCRMTDAGDLPYVWLNANWPQGTTQSDATKKIAALDPYRLDRVEWVRDSSFFNFVYPISYPTPGKRFYSLPHHYSLVTSGWLDVHLNVPAYKSYLMKNQMSLKYHIQVDQEFWQLTFKEKWTKGSADDKKQLKQQWLADMNKSLTSVENAGNALLTEVLWDAVKSEHRELIKVTPINDTTKDGKYIADNMEAAANIFYALGVDPTIVGFAGGEQMGSRSGGSDKREAYLIALQMLQPFRDMLLEPLEFIAEYNGWKARYPDLRFKFRDTILTTLDTGAGTDKKLS